LGHEGRVYASADVPRPKGRGRQWRVGARGGVARAHAGPAGVAGGKAPPPSPFPPRPVPPLPTLSSRRCPFAFPPSARTFTINANNNFFSGSPFGVYGEAVYLWPGQTLLVNMSYNLFRNTPFFDLSYGVSSTTKAVYVAWPGRRACLPQPSVPLFPRLLAGLYAPVAPAFCCALSPGVP
jgi:hypothetical protein